MLGLLQRLPALPLWLALMLSLISCAQITDRPMYATLDDDDSADDDDDDTPTSDCDLGWLVPSEKPVSFSTDLLPIFLDHCGDCHTLKGLGKLRLSAVKAYEQLIDVPNLLDYQQLPRVQPGDPQGSYMMHKIIGCGSSDPVWGYFQAPMPPPVPDAVPLDHEQISLIYSWIVQGAEDN